MIGSKKQQLHFFRTLGDPFQYHESPVLDYHFVPYGKPYSVLHTPTIKVSGRIRIFTLMLSSACQSELRQHVRKNTRSYFRRFRVYTVFVLGSNPVCDDSVSYESSRYNDILQFDHVDSYSNITLSVLYAFQFLQAGRYSIDYVLKTDSDCVINYPLLLSIVSQFDYRSNVYLGNCHVNEPYFTYNILKKNYIPSYIVGSSTIPYYNSGGGYLISYRLLPDVLAAIRYVPFLSHHEDVNVGKAMYLLKVGCIDYTKRWIARNGCDSREKCLSKVIMHPKDSDFEIEQFYSYLAFYSS